MSPNSTRGGWLASIDGLRAISVFLVLLQHKNPHALANVALSNLGVVIFFCISGFLAYYVLHRDNERLGYVDYNYFLTRRVLRIWPAYLTIIALAWLTYPPQANWILLFTFSSNWSMATFHAWPPGGLPHLWTIAVEEQFYVVAPAMYFCLRSRWRWHFCALILVASSALRFWYIHGDTHSGNGGLYYVSFAYADTFLAGAVVAHFYVNGMTALNQYLAFYVSAPVLVAIAWLWPPVLFPPYSILSSLPYAVLPFATALLLFSALPLARTPLNVFLSLGPIVWIGRLSYSLYLVHLPILLSMQPPYGNRLAANLFFLSMVFSSAYFLYSMVELPALKIKDSIKGAGSLPWAIVITWSAIIVGTVLAITRHG